MTTITPQRIAQIEARFAELQAMMASGDLDSDKFVAVSKEYAEIEPVAIAAANVKSLRDEQQGLAEMMASDDAEMKAMAADEVDSVRKALAAAEHALALQLLPKDSADDRPAMLEIRAGTGGDEAALFAGDLYRMYTRYAEEQGWKVEMISANASEVGGFKEVVANIQGTGVFAKLKFESGVHRVQRVPETESGGRIHTSAATVAVLPEPEEVDIKRGPAHRHLPGERRRRPARQQDRQRDPHHPPADRTGGAVPGRQVAAQEQGAGDEGAGGAAL